MIEFDELDFGGLAVNKDDLFVGAFVRSLKLGYNNYSFNQGFTDKEITGDDYIAIVQKLNELNGVGDEQRN